MFSIKSFSKNIGVTIFIGLLLSGFYWFSQISIEKAQIVQAGSSDNASGWAWSSNIGWVSFNCTDTGTCGAVDYGVNVDPVTGNFSGYAWSSSIGWIKFDPAPDFLTGFYPGTPQSPAVLDLVTNEVSGWARACMGTEDGDCASATRTDGWDGWIKLRDAGPPAYGVSWNPSGPNAQELQGWAWGGDVIGWLSFNCITGPGCVNDYFVKVSMGNPPTAVNLSVDKPTDSESCGQESPPVRVRWEFSDLDPGDSQSAYQIQVDDEPSFSPPLVVDTGKSSGASNLYVFRGPLSWNKTYYWRVLVWDSTDLGSVGWAYPPSPPGSPTSIPGTLFLTPPYPYPNPTNFSYGPVLPTPGDSVQFCDDDETCPGGNSFDGDPFAPDVSPSKRISASWSWNFGDGDRGSVADPINADGYPSAGVYTVTFTATDVMDMAGDPRFAPSYQLTVKCSEQKGVTVSFGIPSPLWREVSPF